MILQYTVVYMHISWFIHISHTTVRTLRPKPLLKGLSSKASEKITHRLKVFSHAVGPLKVTRLHHVPQAVSSTVLHPFQSNWPQHGSSALALKYLKLPPFTSYIGLMMFLGYSAGRSIVLRIFYVTGSECRLSKRIYNTLCIGREGVCLTAPFRKD